MKSSINTIASVSSLTQEKYYHPSSNGALHEGPPKRALPQGPPKGNGRGKTSLFRLSPQGPLGGALFEDRRWTGAPGSEGPLADIYRCS